MLNNKKPHGRDSLLIQLLSSSQAECGNAEANDINKMRDIILMADKQVRGKYKWVRVQ